MLSKSVRATTADRGWRARVVATAAAVSLSLGAGATAETGGRIAEKTAEHFSSVRTMTGEFLQLGSDGSEIGGTFFIERPGKLRFNYEAPSPLRVIADGRSVVIGNRKLQTWDIYLLDNAPLKLLLADRIDLSDDIVRSVSAKPDLTTIVLGNESIFGRSTIALLFDSKTYALRQWTITDPRERDTTVILFNVRTGVRFAENVFKVPYDQVHAERFDNR